MSVIRLTIAPYGGGGALAAGGGVTAVPLRGGMTGGTCGGDRLVTAKAVRGLAGWDLFQRRFDKGQKFVQYQGVGHSAWGQFAGRGHVFALPECP